MKKNNTYYFEKITPLFSGFFLYRIVYLLLTATICFCGFQAKATVYQVTSLAATGAGTLHQAILDANAGTGTNDIISFANFSGGTITPDNKLPDITKPGLTIDGYTATGATAGTLTGRNITMIIDCVTAYAYGDVFTIKADNVTIRGFVMNNAGNYAGNGFIRVNPEPTGTANNVKIQGNYFGTNQAGTALNGSNAMCIYTTGTLNNGISNVHNLVIGTDGNGNVDDKEGNLFAGNQTNYELVRLYECDAPKFSGNIGGLDKTGTTIIGNAHYAVSLENCIDGLVGSNGDGLSDALERNVLFSRIGASVTLQYNGPGVTSPALFPTRVTGNNSVAGNYLGTDITGTINLNGFACVYTVASNGNYIGAYKGASLVVNAATRNVMAARTQSLVQLAAQTNTPQAPSDYNTVINNYIGLGANGSTAFTSAANASGVLVTGGKYNVVTNNIIANNGAAGVTINAPGFTMQQAYSNKITQNSIYNNFRQGIVLQYISNGNDGAYTPTSTFVTNRHIDYPVINAATLINSALTVTGFVGNLAGGSTTFANMTVEIFAADNTPADQNSAIIVGDGKSVAHGEGRVYLGSLTTDANSKFAGTLTLTAPQVNSLSASWNNGLTSTTTSPDGNTSQFGPNQPVTIGVTITGTIINDANANTTIQSGETGTNAGLPAPLYVYMVNNSGNIAGLAEVGADGTYSLNAAQNTSYSLYLSEKQYNLGDPASTIDRTPPADWVTTGENGNGSSDGTPNGVLGATTTTTGLANQNFGIQPRPTAGEGSNSAYNPGGTAMVLVPASTFSNGAQSTDPSTGTVSYLLITAFPTNTTSITINGTNYASAAAFNAAFPNGASIAVDAYARPTQPIYVDPATDGTVTVTIPFKAIDNAGAQSTNTGQAVLNLTALSVSGTVYNDFNGMVDNTVNGPGMAEGSIYVLLVNNQNIVVKSTTVDATGAYTFSNVPSNTNFKVILSTQAFPCCSTTVSSATYPPSYYSTGEKLGTGTGRDGMIDGILSVYTGYVNVTQANLAVQQPPTANNVSADYTNPGGTTTVTAPTLNGSDPEQGIFPGIGNQDTIVIKTLPSGGTLYYNNAPVVAGDTIRNYNPTLLTFDPPTGTGTYSFDYVEIDAALKASNVATATMNFGDLTISGTVRNDFNGGVIDGPGIGSPTSTKPIQQLYANLVAQNGTVLGSVPVNADGNYILGSAQGVTPNTSFSVILSITEGLANTQATTLAPVGNITTVPAQTWVNTAEGNTNTLGDGVANGITTVMVGSNTVPGIDFGIEEAPNALDVSWSVNGAVENTPYILGTSSLDVSGNKYLNGNDPEEGIFTGNSTKTFIITSLPNTTYFTLTYNGNPLVLTNGKVEIPNFNSSLLGIIFKRTDIPYESEFTYQVKDAAGETSPDATYTILAIEILPVTGLQVKASLDANGLATLQWSTFTEANTSYFEVEHSSNGTVYTPVAKVPAAGHSNSIRHYTYAGNSPLSDVAYFRIRLYDQDGKSRVSNIEALSKAANKNFTLLPNPAHNFVTVTGLTTKQKVIIASMNGTKLLHDESGNATRMLKIANYPAGIYILQVWEDGKAVYTARFVKQ